MFELKIKSKTALIKIVAALRKSGKRVVFTNGCFDILHYGHAKYLETAKAKGDFLVVGVNSDSSVRKLKGNSRPVISQNFRARMISALEAVDFVVIFSEATPLKIIQALKPDVLVKGGDWKEEDIVGADFVKQLGGRVYSIKFIKGFSTTDIIKKIGQGS
jgi:rfaE bifunctional protein nucleotidyltransferase chain/domain